MSGGKPLSQSETRIEALSLQSSAFGVTIPLLYGVNRIPGNLIWYGGFKATPHTSSSGGGKGGVKAQNTTYTYSASVMMGLCEGQITGISRAWKGKLLYTGGVLPTELVWAAEGYLVPSGGGTFTVTYAATFASASSVSYTSGVGTDSESHLLAEGADYTRVGGVYTFGGQWSGTALYIQYQRVTGGGSQTALQAMGLSFAAGALGQAVWPFLNTFAPDTPPGGGAGSQALGYSGLAYVYAQDYQLGTSATVDNHTFEVQGPQAYSISATVPDANPCTVTQDILANGRYGAAFPSAQLGSINAWSNYCLASGLLMSPALTEQMQAGELVALMCKLTNTAPVWSGGKLKTIPYGDQDLTGNGATYSANVTPVYDLTDDDFIGGGDPIRITRKPQADAYNHVRVEFCNRANLYNVEIAEAKDSANIDAFGLRSAEIVSAHWICEAAVARTVAQLLLQRALYVRNTYEFTLPWTKVLLEAMDLVTLTDTGLGLDKLPARIVSIEEDEDGYLAVVCEDFPLGVAHAALYESEPAAGFQHDYNAAPGSVAAPLIFEAPGALTQNGLEVYVAATGLAPAWGGAHLWVSLDGTNYRQAATMHGGSRYGSLTAAAGATGDIAVALRSGTLASAGAADAAALNSLCFIQSAGGGDEYFAFNTASLTSALHYTLGGSVRGAYLTAPRPHSAGDGFVRVDDGIGRSGTIDLGYVGKTIHVKLTSFNIYGAAEESLASVADYTYTITGEQIYGNAGAAAVAGLTSIASDSVLSPGEKSAVVQDYAVITGEQVGIDAQAAAYGIAAEKASYDSAVAALTAYLGTLPGWDTIPGADVAIVGATFRAKFAAVYGAKQALMNKIAAVAGTLATWTGVSARPANLNNLTGAENLGLNLLNARNWVIGSSGDQLGADGTAWIELPTSAGGANVIDYGNGPDGAMRALWKATSGGAAGTSSEGGIAGTARIAIDTSKPYRFTCWVAINAAGGAGMVYAGIEANSVETLPSPYGTPDVNPYFCVLGRSGFVPNRWYLFVGHVLPNTSGNTQFNQGGIYDSTTGQKLHPGADFRWHAGVTSCYLRTFQFYTAEAGCSVWWCQPRFEMLDGSEPSIAALLSDAVLARANSAYTAAASAQTDATAANTALAVISNDSILSRGEKPQVILDYNAIVDEQSRWDAQANYYGLSHAAYDSYVAALGGYLASVNYSNTATDDAIVRPTFDLYFRNVYASRQDLANAIASAAGSVATWAGVSGAGKPASYATVGKSLGLPFESWNLNGQSLVTLSDGKVGTSALRLTGAVYAWPNQGNYVAIDATKKYRARFWARPMASTSGALYFSLRQFVDAAGTYGSINGGRWPFKPNGQSRAGHNAQFGGTDQWGEYSYIWDAADWQAGAAFVQPEFLDNHPVGAGYWEVQDFTFEEVTEVLVAQTAANAAATAASNAQTVANAANTALANIASDNVLTRGEKPAVIIDWTTISNEQAGIDAQANVYGITTEKAAYDSAVSALGGYLGGLSPGWSDVSQDTAITGTTFRSNFAAAYTARQALLNAISMAAATKVGQSNMVWGLSSPQSMPDGGYGGTIFTIRTGGEASNPYGIKAGETLTLSADLWCDAATVAAGQNSTLYLFTARSNGAWTVANIISNASTTPERFSAIFPVPALDADAWGIYVGLYHQGTNCTTSPTGRVYADRIQVERGPVATPYKPGAQPGATVGADWTSNLAGRPKAFRVGAVGYVATSYPISSGLYDGETGTLIAGAARSYAVDVFRRSDAVLLSSTTYDVCGGAAATMAAALNLLGSDVIVCIRTCDEPQANRLNAGLAEAMYRHGASRAVFGSPKFRYRSAYVLVAIGACGEGNGCEAYQGERVVDSYGNEIGDPNAWCDVSFTIQNGRLQTGFNFTPRSLIDFGYVQTADIAAAAATDILTLPITSDVYTFPLSGGVQYHYLTPIDYANTTGSAVTIEVTSSGYRLFEAQSGTPNDSYANFGVYVGTPASPQAFGYFNDNKSWKFVGGVLVGTPPGASFSTIESGVSVITVPAGATYRFTPTCNIAQTSAGTGNAKITTENYVLKLTACKR